MKCIYWFVKIKSICYFGFKMLIEEFEFGFIKSSGFVLKKIIKGYKIIDLWKSII